MPTIRIMSGSTSQPNWVGSGWRMAYSPNFQFAASIGNLSLQYVNSKSSILRFRLGKNMVWL